jgi:hypothetical protein
MSQEPTSEHWWADVLADPRAGIWRQPRGFDGRDGRRTALYRLADESSPLIEGFLQQVRVESGVQQGRGSSSLR